MLTAIEGDVDAMTINPAGLASMKNIEVTLSYLSLFDEAGLFAITGGIQLPGNLGVAAVNVTTLSIKDIPNYDGAGNLLPNLNASDLLVTLGYGKEFNLLRPFNAGANIKIYSTKLGEANSSAFAVDLGLQTKFSIPMLSDQIADNLIIGAAVQNLGTGEKFVTETSDLPAKLNIGVNYMLYNSNNIDGAVLIEVDKTSELDAAPAIGAEIGLYKIVKLRVGYRLSNTTVGDFSFGVSAGINMIAVEYAMIPSTDFGSTQTIGLRASF